MPQYDGPWIASERALITQAEILYVCSHVYTILLLWHVIQYISVGECIRFQVQHHDKLGPTALRGMHAWMSTYSGACKYSMMICRAQLVSYFVARLQNKCRKQKRLLYTLVLLMETCRARSFPEGRTFERSDLIGPAPGGDHGYGYREKR